MKVPKNRKINNEPIEKNLTAAWADIEKLKSVSRVPIPRNQQVKEVKEWVDKNQK